MRPVKKPGRTASPKATGKAGRKAASGASSKTSRRSTDGRKKQTSTKRAAAKGGRRAGRTPAEVEKVIMRVRELDPREKIGPGTGVQRLFRVDAASGGASETHLVFLDRHGLYCEHGKGCPAVGEVTKLDKSLRRTNKVG